MFESGDYVYKKQVDWSVLMEGLTLPVKNQVVFGRIMDRFLEKGEKKEIRLCLDGKIFKAHVVNVNYSDKFSGRSDVLQIRYPKNGELAQALQKSFVRTFTYLEYMRGMREEGSRKQIKIDDDKKEYLAIYTTTYDDTYLLETIESDAIDELKEHLKGKEERVFELEYNFETEDGKSTWIESSRTIKIRKLNKKIGDNLKVLYDYRCQICGKAIGEPYNTKIAEAHHIDYFVKSMNNNASNQMIVCPNHHSVIHSENPLFDKNQLAYIYPNGYVEKLVMNQHL